MTVFSIAAAAMLLVACLFVLVPLLRYRRAATAVAATGADSSGTNLAVLREQQAQLDADLAAQRIDVAQHRSARIELERRVLEEEASAEAAPRGGSTATLAWVLALAVPLFAVGLYARLGSTAALQPAAAAAPQVSSQDVEAMVAKLAKRMESQPDDPKGWTMLGRSYAAMQRFPESAKAYARAVALQPDNPQLLVDYADVLAAIAQSAAGEPTRLITRALQLEPDNPKGLALAGSAAFERRDFAGAIAYWTKARSAVPPDSEFARSIDSSIAEARAAAGQAAAPVPAASATAQGAAAAPMAAAGAERIGGRVSVAPELAGRVTADDTVFIYARAAEGPRMPLAILRHKAGDLPLTFRLDDSLAMAPNMKLSNFSSVIVEARVSKSGEAVARSGDLRGQVGPVKPGSAELVLVIDSVQP